MYTRGISRNTLPTALIAIIIFALLLSACQPATSPASLPSATAQPATSLPPTAVPSTATQPAPTAPAATDTQAPTQPAASTTTGEVTVNLTGVASGQTAEIVKAVTDSAGGPYWEIAPQYHRVTLHGYPVTNHLLKPQIFVYAVTDLAATNEAAGKIAASLQTLLQNQPVEDRLPYLPLYNAQQVMHAQVKYLDFKNGKGVRFLTQFDQAPLPINNFELVYTFQGLTSDGKYYVSAVLPVTNPTLPANSLVDAQMAKLMADFPAYLAKAVPGLENQPASSFIPDLAKLDALVQSIEIK